MHAELKTLDDLVALTRKIQRKGRSPMSHEPLRGPEDVAQATLAWVGLTKGRKFDLRPIAKRRRRPKPAANIIFSKKMPDGTYEFVDDFDKLKSTLYYVLVRQLRKHP